MGTIKASLADWCREHGAEALLACYEAAFNPQSADRIGYSSGQKVRFRCPACGFEWSRTLNHATRKGARLDCPRCNGRAGRTLREQYPELARQWDYQNNELGPDRYSCGSNQKVHWICERCLNSWTAVISDRVCAAERVRRKGGELCPFCGKQKVSTDYNFSELYPDLSHQWDVTRNRGLRPDACFPASNQAVWWKCPFDESHIWKDRIANRTLLHRGCPHCSRIFKTTYTSRVLFYYLRQVFPDCACEYPVERFHLDLCLTRHRIAIEHHEYRHQTEAAQKKDISRRDELEDMGYRVLWLVESDRPMEGYCREGNVLTYYDPAPHYRMNELVRYVLDWLVVLTGAPLQNLKPDYYNDHSKIEALFYQERKNRSLASLYPELVEEWDPENTCRPDTVFPDSRRKVRWRCRVCGELYSAGITARVRNRSGCPRCTHRSAIEKTNAAVRYPHLLEEWDESNDKRLDELMPGSEYLAAWVCRTCGHRWKTMLYNRANPKGSGCPACGKRIPMEGTSFASLYPEMAALWHPVKNGDVTPDQVMAKSNKPRWWLCEKGHAWQTAPNRMAKIREPSSCCPYCNDRKLGPDNSLAVKYPELAREWHPEKNGALTPWDVTGSLEKHAWWRCEHGHSFRALINARAKRGAGCPYCANVNVSVDNCLSTLEPELAREWHPEKNGSLTPADVTARSAKEVWWRCEKGHAWQAPVCKRSVRGQGCPYCAGRRISKETSLAALCPELAAQWHPQKNGDLTAWDVSPGCRKKVWWKCPNGHEWEAAVSNRRKGRGCPLCTSKKNRTIPLAEASPALAGEWFHERNTLTPETCASHSNKKVWWRCAAGHAWQATPDARMGGSGCPYCTGRLASPENCLAATYPDIAAEWDAAANGEWTPEQVLPHSNRRAAWVCRTCGFRWSAPIVYRTDGSGCPACRKQKNRRRVPGGQAAG